MEEAQIQEQTTSPLNKFNIFHSEEMNLLFDAMSKAQRQMGKLISNETNPFYKAKYPTLDVVIDVYRDPISENGLTFMQWSLTGGKMMNILGHKSGQYIANVEELRIKKDKDNEQTPQAHGSAYSYLRRYSAMGVMGLGKASEDDDGNKASGKKEDSRNQGGSRGSGGSQKSWQSKSKKDDFDQQLADQGKVDFKTKPDSPVTEEPTKDQQIVIDDAKSKIDEAEVLSHLNNIWSKHQKDWREKLPSKLILEVQKYKDEKKNKLIEERDMKTETKETEGV